MTARLHDSSLSGARDRMKRLFHMFQGNMAKTIDDDGNDIEPDFQVEIVGKM